MIAQEKPLEVYDQPHQFEPLLPRAMHEQSALRTRGIIEASLKLQGSVHENTLVELKALLRSMNSYYSNLIEGQSTHPINIDRALHQNFSSKPDVAKRQRIALAHIGAETALEGFATDEGDILSSGFLIRSHKALYERLSEADRVTEEGRLVVPGQLRQEDVAVYRHHPPIWQAIPAFLKRGDETYAKSWGLDHLLIAIASAHHRWVWVHPFLDGNGRAARLQTHCALQKLTGGLWSVNRGLARSKGKYYEHLSNADMPRHGDLDGRGNLSEKMLLSWCEFFLGICEDQVSFMTRMLDLKELKQRLAQLILVRSEGNWGDGYRKEAILPLHHVLAVGSLSRGEFIQMTGLHERTGRKVLSQLLADGLLRSQSSRADVSIGLPLDALNILFPNLYPEAAAALDD